MSGGSIVVAAVVIGSGDKLVDALFISAAADFVVPAFHVSQGGSRVVAFCWVGASAAGVIWVNSQSM